MASAINKNEIGDRIANRLETIGMDKQKFAALLKRHNTRISKYLKGKDLTLDLLDDMAGVLGCSLVWLIVGEESDQSVNLRTIQTKVDAATLLLLSGAILLRGEHNEAFLIEAYRRLTPFAQLLKDVSAQDLSGSLEQEVLKHGLRTAKGTDSGASGANGPAKGNGNEGNPSGPQPSKPKKR